MISKRQSAIHQFCKERKKLLQELPTFSLLLRASFFKRFSTCIRPLCRCHHGRKHGPRGYLALTQQKTQKQHYVPQRQVRAVLKGIQQYHRLLRIINRLTAINLILMKKGVLDESANL